MRIVFPVLMLAVCLLVMSCGGGSSGDHVDPATPEAPANGSWTFMVYMAADNTISNAAKADINEMESVGSSSDVSIIVQVEFNKNESPELPVSTVRGRVFRDQNQANIGTWYTEIGNKDMTDPETLKEFITWSVQHYPAERYALVLWSHGSGWKVEDGSPLLSKGMMADTTSSGSSHIMSLTEISKAVLDSGVRFDLINFDSCLMGMYEVAYEFKDLASFLVFSENVYPVNGDAYDTILQELTASPDMDGARLARTTAAKCREFYASKGTAMTKSAIDMAQIDRLQTLLITLSQYLSEHLAAEKNHVEDACNASVSFEYPGHHDLGDFLQKLDGRTSDQDLKTIIGDLRETLSQAIIANEVYTADPADSLPDSQGIAIYLPSPTQASQDDLDLYSSLACNRSSGVTWGDLVYRLVTGNSNLESQKAPGNFAVRIEWDTDADIDLYIFEPDDTAAAPRYGAQSGDNGTCSSDSHYSGDSFEYYESFEDVEPGSYDVFINYYESGSDSPIPTTVSCLIRDPSQGMNEYTRTAQQGMDISNPLPDNGTIDDGDRNSILDNLYSDWWYAGSIVRSASDGGDQAGKDQGEASMIRSLSAADRLLWFMLKI